MNGECWKKVETSIDGRLGRSRGRCEVGGGKEGIGVRRGLVEGKRRSNVGGNVM